MTKPVARLSDDHRQAIVDHCLSQLPNEGCGLLAMTGDLVTRVYPTGNTDRSPWSYTIPPEEHYAVLVDAEANGWVIGGVFHSHPDGPAAMSKKDIEMAIEPDWVYVVVGLKSDSPDLILWQR